MRASRTSGSMSGAEETGRGYDSARGVAERPSLAAGADKPERNRASRRLYSITVISAYLFDVVSGDSPLTIVAKDRRHPFKRQIPFGVLGLVLNYNVRARWSPGNKASRKARNFGSRYTLSERTGN